jgi:hypothetical protein
MPEIEHTCWLKPVKEESFKKTIYDAYHFLVEIPIRFTNVR